MFSSNYFGRMDAPLSDCSKYGQHYSNRPILDRFGVPFCYICCIMPHMYSGVGRRITTADHSTHTKIIRKRGHPMHSGEFYPGFFWDRVDSRQFVPLQLCIEGLAIDFEDSGCLALVPFHQFQYLLDMGLFNNPERLY